MIDDCDDYYDYVYDDNVDDDVDDYVLTEETLDEIGERLEHTPQKSLKRLSEETGVFVSSVQRATNLLNLKPYKIPAVHKLHQPDPNMRLSASAVSTHYCCIIK